MKNFNLRDKEFIKFANEFLCLNNEKIELIPCKDEITNEDILNFYFKIQKFFGDYSDYMLTEMLFAYKIKQVGINEFMKIFYKKSGLSEVDINEFDIKITGLYELEIMADHFIKLNEFNLAVEEFLDG